jgi:glycosyltransferase involved in cell wall biosynthesis
MRVLHVIPSVAARYGGPSQAVVGYCRALEHAGIDTFIATTNADGPGVLDVPVGVPTRFDGLSAMFFERRGEAFKFSAGLARWLAAGVGQFDVVHIHAVFSHPSLAAARACQRAGVPYVVRPLGSLDPWSLSQGAWKKRLLMQAAVKRMLRDAAAIHFTTDAERELAEPVSQGTRAVVIPPGIDRGTLAAPVPTSHQREPIVVTLSRLDPKKNLESLIGSFHRLASDPARRSWRLVIAGEGAPEYRRHLVELASCGAAADRIEFAGWVSGADKLALLARAAIFALPSHQENFGIGLLEALACGTPAIVSNRVNLADEMHEAGAGWVASSDAEFECLLGERMDDTGASLVEAGHAARAFAARFEWSRVAARLAELYTSLTCAASPVS